MTARNFTEDVGRALVRVLVTALRISGAVPGQSAATQRFDVASVKTSQPDARPYANFPLDDGDAYLPGGRFLARASVPTCISFAYKLALSQEQVHSMVAGLPKWFADELFDIEARAEGN